MAVLRLPISVSNLPQLYCTSDKPQWLLPFSKPSHLQEVYAKPASISTNETLHLLALPTEIRLQVYGHVLAQTDCFRHSHTRPPSQSTALSLLRVNKAIYNEARLLPFQLSSINFQKWYGSSVFCCTAFLKSIQDWQRREVRTLSLTVNGRELSGWQAREGWLQICKLLSAEAHVPAGVRTITLCVNGTRGFNWDALLNMDAAWVSEGLQSIRSLKNLVIVLSDADVDKELVLRFKESISQFFPTVEIRTEGTLPVEPPVEERRTSAFSWSL
ncbi:hypothetical protein MMC26_006799 [Xylographa opegraphella]|nr:hypothetical protein [Xylographa opegraphella]